MNRTFEELVNTYGMTQETCKCEFCKERNTDILFPNKGRTSGAHIACVLIPNKAEIKGKTSKNAKRPSILILTIKVFEDYRLYAYLRNTGWGYIGNGIFQFKALSLSSVSKSFNEARQKFPDSIKAFNTQFFEYNNGKIEKPIFEKEWVGFTEDADVMGALKHIKASIERTTTSHRTDSHYYKYLLYKHC